VSPGLGADEAVALADAFEASWRTSIISFWYPRAIDAAGGYRVGWDARGRPDKDERGTVTQARLVYVFARAARAVAAEGAASVSLVQRKFNVGYSRAGRIVDQLAENHVVGGYQGSKSREVMMNLPDVDELGGAGRGARVEVDAVRGRHRLHDVHVRVHELDARRTTVDR